MGTPIMKNGILNGVAASYGNPSKKNKIGVVSQDNSLHEVFGEVLTRQGFDLSILGLEELVNSPQNFYLVDLKGLDNYLALTGQIKALREQRPDSELVLLQIPSALSRPQALPLKAAVQRYLVPVYEKPSESIRDYKSELEKFVERTLSEHIRRFLTQPSVIKVGGSIWDLYKERSEVLMTLLEEITRLHSEKYPIILTTGGGPRQVTEGELSKTYGTHPASKDVLERQAKDTVGLLGDVAVYIPPSRVKSYDFNSDFMRQHIPVVSLSGEKISPNESDTHTLAFAEQLRLYKVIFAKDTDGVYERDPYRQPRRVRAIFPIPSFLLVEDNRFFPQIYASEILSGAIDRRDAEGTGEHLIETNALFYLRSTTQSVRAVQVVNGTKPKLLRGALDGSFVGSYILRG